MEKVYFNIDDPSSFSSINSLQKATGVQRKKAEKYLEKQPVYRKFKAPKTKFPRARIHVKTVGSQFMSDLFDLHSLSKHNKGYKWILLVVDAFSRYVKCEPIKNKSGPSVAEALDNIFSSLKEENKIAPRSYLSTDLGNEFYNSHANSIYEKHGISHFPLRGPIKCSLAEISGRYIVGKLHKIMYHNGNKRWIDVLQRVVTAKNKRKNKKTKNLSPLEITYENQADVYKSLYPDGVAPTKFNLNIGDRVQVAKTRLPFAKSYHGYYSEKIYRVIKQHALDVPRYSIADEEDDEPIAGTYYEEELFPV